MSQRLHRGRRRAVGALVLGTPLGVLLSAAGPAEAAVFCNGSFEAPVIATSFQTVSAQCSGPCHQGLVK